MNGMLAELRDCSNVSATCDCQPVILLVEDEELVRYSAGEFLRFSDFQVIEAATGDEAVALLSSGLEVDLVFSDIRMPGRLDGFGLAHWLSIHRPTVPILLTSGFTGSGRDPQPVRPILPKPYRFDQLLRKIGEMLAKRAHAYGG